MRISRVFSAYLIIMQVDIFAAENLYAASVHWRPVSTNGANKDNEILLSYKLIWEQGNVPNCPKPNNDTGYGRGCFFVNSGLLNATQAPYSRWSGYKWKCTDGCSASISDLSSLIYTHVGTFNGISWEAAMEMKLFTFNSKDDLANIKIGFYDSANKPVNGLGDASFNMAIRNDTKRANISPAMSPLPYYGVPLGCTINIDLYPFDGDGDYVRCHWQTFPTAGSVEATAVLNEDKCQIQIQASSQSGFTIGQSIPFYLFAEDYSEKPVQFSKLSKDITTGPFSRTPVMFLLHVSASVSDCNSGPKFIEAGTLPHNSIQSYPLPFANAKLPFKIPTDDGQIILTSGPRKMHFRTNNKSDTFEGTWDYISDTSLTGIHQACGMAYTKDGVSGESRCAVLLVNEPNECPCPKLNGIDGVCRNLFEYYTCSYPPASNNQQQQTMCKPVKPVNESNDDLGVRVGLPVGLSLLLLIIIIATTLYLKHKWDKKMNKSSVNPENLANNVGKVAVDF